MYCVYVFIKKYIVTINYLQSLKVTNITIIIYIYKNLKVRCSYSVLAAGYGKSVKTKLIETFEFKAIKNREYKQK